MHIAGQTITTYHNLNLSVIAGPGRESRTSHVKASQNVRILALTTDSRNPVTPLFLKYVSSIRHTCGTTILTVKNAQISANTEVSGYRLQGARYTSDSYLPKTIFGKSRESPCDDPAALQRANALFRQFETKFWRKGLFMKTSGNTEHYRHSENKNR